MGRGELMSIDLATAMVKSLVSFEFGSWSTSNFAVDPAAGVAYALSTVTLDPQKGTMGHTLYSIPMDGSAVTAIDTLSQSTDAIRYNKCDTTTSTSDVDTSGTNSSDSSKNTTLSSADQKELDVQNQLVKFRRHLELCQDGECVDGCNNRSCNCSTGPNYTYVPTVPSTGVALADTAICCSQAGAPDCASESGNCPATWTNSSNAIA